MKNVLKAFAVGTALLLVGCATPNAAKLNDTTLQIQRGMSYQELLELVSEYPVQRTFIANQPQAVSESHLLTSLGVQHLPRGHL